MQLKCHRQPAGWQCCVIYNAPQEKAGRIDGWVTVLGDKIRVRTALPVQIHTQEEKKTGTCEMGGEIETV